ncbi:hypothetical protein KI387_024985, partial [Taxus chinensis]
MGKDEEFGGDSVAAEKLEALEKYKRRTKARKYMGYVTLSVAVAAVSWIYLVETLKPSLRFLCVDTMPQLLVICRSTLFLFVVSNTIVMILAVDSGMFASSQKSFDFYSEFVISSKGSPSYLSATPLRAPARRYERSRSENIRAPPVKNFRRSYTCREKMKPGSSEISLENNVKGASVFDEEFKRRVDKFIADFNRQLSLQSQQS